MNDKDEPKVRPTWDGRVMVEKGTQQHMSSDREADYTTTLDCSIDPSGAASEVMRLQDEVERLSEGWDAEVYVRALMRRSDTQKVLWEAVDDVVVGVETPASLLNRKKIVDAVTSALIGSAHATL